MTNLRRHGTADSIPFTTRSKSQTAGDEESNQEQHVKVKTTFIQQYLIPLVAEVNRSTKPVLVLKIFEHVFIAVQIYISSYFYFSPQYQRAGMATQFFTTIFLGFYGDYDDMDPAFWINIIVNFLTLAIFLVCAISYNQTHELKKFPAYVLQIWHSNLYHIFIIPTFQFIGCSIGRLSQNITATTIIYVMVSMLCGGYLIYHVFLISILINRSPYLSHKLIHMWRPRDFYMMIFLLAAPTGVASANKDLPFFTHVIQHLAFILFAGYICKIFFFDNSASILPNAFWFSLGFASSVNSITNLINKFGVNMHYSLYIFLPLGFGFVILIITLFMFYIRRRSIVRMLSYSNFDDDGELNDSVKEEYFSAIKIRNVDEAILYLTVGLEYNCDLFLDWSFPRYLAQLYPGNNDVLLFITWMFSFFPSETHLLHVFLSSCETMVTPSIENKSMYYQIHRIHIFRQSTVCQEINSDFTSMKRFIDHAIRRFCQFWKSIASNEKKDESLTTVYQQLTETRLRTDAIMNEVLDKYPNNCKFAYEYSRYLLDALCSYKAAVKWRIKATRMENGQRLENDKMFHRFVLMYPHYLKTGIVDTKGTIRGIMEQGRKLIKEAHSIYNIFASSNSSNNASLGSSTSNDDDMSASLDLEQNDVESFLPQSLLRLALERNVSEIRSENIRRVQVSAITRLIFTLLYCIISFLLISQLFDDKTRFFDCYQNLNKVQHTMCVLTHRMIWSWAYAMSPSLATLMENKFNEFPPDKAPGMNSNVEPSSLSGGWSDQSLQAQLLRQSSSALNMLKDFTNVLYEDSIDDDRDLYLLANILSNTPTSDTICRIDDTTGKIIKVENDLTVTHDFLIRSFLSTTSFLSLQTVQERQKWYENNIVCNYYILHWKTLDSISKTITATVYPYQVEYELWSEGNVSKYLLEDDDFPDTEINEEKMANVDPTYANKTFIIDFVIAFSPFFASFFILPAIIYLSIGIKQEWDNYTTILKQFPPSVYENASKVLMADALDEKDIDTIQETFHFQIPVYVPHIASAALVIILLILLAILSEDEVKKIDYNSSYFLLDIQTRNLLFYLGNDAILSVFINQHYNKTFEFTAYPAEMPDFLKLDEVLERLEKEIELYQITINMLDLGSDFFPSATQFESTFMNKELCFKNNGEFINNEINFFQCLSMNRLIDYFVDKVRGISTSATNYNLSDDAILNLAYLIDTRLDTEFESLIVGYEEIYTNLVQQFNIIAWIFLIISMFSCVLAFFSDLHVLNKISLQLDTFKSLILRVDPVSFVSNQQMLLLVNGKQQAMFSTIVSASHAVFTTSHDAIVSINSETIIEEVNPSATKTFGFLPEQLIGQPLKMIIKGDDSNQLYNVMNLMKSGQSSLSFEAEITGTKDDDTTVPLKATLLGYASNGSENATSFAIMMIDITEELNQKKKVEEAKKQSENLLLQILPPNIILRLNRGDKEITFTVHQSTIIFIDIEKFSNFMSSLSASELMTNLSNIFNAYDSNLAKYSLMTKIKLIGDDYMAAAGLFSEDHTPDKHANQALMFALDCLDSIEDINLHLNTNLQVRVGINTDGPLIAGVLGTDKPLFDIIGDPINVAARMQSHDIPGLIQISQKTYDLVATGPYTIDQRGEIPIKGKGNMMTYLVHPRPRKYDESELMTDRRDESMDQSFINQSFISKNSNISQSFELSSGQQINPRDFSNLDSIKASATLMEDPIDESY